VFAGHIVSPGRIELVDVPAARLDSPVPGAPRPPVGPRFVFEPELACLCGSDLPFFDGTHGRPGIEVGHSLHEMIGRVVETDGTRFRPGDRVLAVPFDQVGFFQRYVVPEDRAIPLDPRAADEAALLAQPLGTVIYGLKKLPSLLDLDVGVVGQGPIGQMFVACLRNLGAREIVAIDKVASRLEHSPRLGATRTVDVTREDPVAVVHDLTEGRLLDVVVEAVGHDDQCLTLCTRLARHAGRILYFGVPPETLDGVRWLELFYKNLTVHTTVNPDFRRDFPLAMRWIAERRIDLSPLQTHRYPVSRIQEAFETFAGRREGALKVLVDFPRA
jgi:threonine dehydrogenase-like Zn-dependent dehydrogenase